MIKIGFYSNKTRDKNYELSSELIRHLDKRFCQICLCDEISELSDRFPNAITCGISETDFLVVLGGDGTFLRAARKAAASNTPMLGINLGSLGYLTDVELPGGKEAIDKLLSGNYRLEKRTMLQANISGKTQTALNDAYVTIKSGTSKLLKLSLDINDEFMDSYQADGILISTPTGSTAYNLSAGGPILKPDSDIFAITPVCPHALHARPAIVSASDKIIITVNSDSGGELYMDGEISVGINQGEKVTISRSDSFTTIVKTNNLGFYDILRKKLKWS